MDTDNIVLTEGQENALTKIQDFLLDPIESVFVLRGYSGCGKSTLVRTIIDRIPGFFQMAKMVDPNTPDYQVELTATTNKAAENLGFLSGGDATTIHSFLGLRINTDYKTGKTTLTKSGKPIIYNTIIFIDEASYIDSDLLGLIFEMTDKCKIIFIGDPAQLTPVKATRTPVFDAHFRGAALTEVVRQAEGNLIIDLATKFRHTVNTGEFFKFKPDGIHIKHMNRDDFNDAVLAEFGRADWNYKQSQVLAWTNKKVIQYNDYVNAHRKGVTHFVPGDYAVNNNYVQLNKKAIKTDEMVYITEISEDMQRYGVDGNIYTINGMQAFKPHDWGQARKRLKQAQNLNEFDVMKCIMNEWVDLRAVYARTVNKAQGSTHDSVYIDLDDIARCNSGDQIARMMYVAVSRARNLVVLTGDLG